LIIVISRYGIYKLAGFNNNIAIFIGNAGMFKDLDRIDRKLLALLDTDSRQSFSKLAKSLRLGSDLVEYRVSNYISSGMIERFSVVADPFSVGWWVVKNYVKLKTNPKKLRSILNFVKSHKDSYWIAELYGRFDLLFSYVADSPRDCRIFEEEFKDISTDSIVDFHVAIATRLTRFSRKYFRDNGAKGEAYVFSPERDSVSLDEVDVKLVSLLYDNARYTLTYLANEVSMTSATVAKRIERLEEAKVILGYRFQLNYQVIGLLFFKLLLQLSDYTKEFRQDLYEYCKGHLNVTCFVEQIGVFPIEIEVEVLGYDDLNKFIDEFRVKFDKGISNFEVLLIRKDHLHRFPESLI
jgi:DNA-binding Lrp family transcriptional regulator